MSRDRVPPHPPAERSLRARPGQGPAVLEPAVLEDEELDRLERAAVGYFLRAWNPANGLIADSSRRGSPCSISATGLGLAAYVVGAERGYLSRPEAAARTLAALRFLRESRQGEERDATGHRGFYYHFLDWEGGRRIWDCELSMIDTAILIAGVLTAAAYFSAAADGEPEIRELAAFLYRRIDWAWAAADAPLVRMGWKPEAGFLSYGWGGYSEALLLYVLGLGSPNHPLAAGTYRAWTDSYQWENLYDIDFLFAAPLFVHQLSHVWIDLRGIRDAFMREKRSDYFENSRRAIAVQRQYARRNPKGFEGYGEDCWGITSGLGPGPALRPGPDGVARQFYGYVARGVPFGPDDGTLAPWAVAASLPFAPGTVSAALRHFRDVHPECLGRDGLLTSINASFAASAGGAAGDGEGDGDANRRTWVSAQQLGLDQGPVALMIENHRSGLVWRLLRECPVVRAGLRRAGFSGGWLGSGDR